MFGSGMIIETFRNILALTHINILTRWLDTGYDVHTTVVVDGVTLPTGDMSLDGVSVGKRHIYSPKTKSISQITRCTVVR